MTTSSLRRLAAAALTAAAASAATGAGPAHAATDPTLQLPRVWINETDSGSAPVLINAQLDRPNPYAKPISVIVGDFTTRPVPGSNPPRTYGEARPGEDYATLNSFRLTWAPGQRIASFPITLLGDTRDEGDEEIDVRFSGGDGVHITDNDIDLVINDNDPLGTANPLAPPVPKLTNTLIYEGDAGCAPHQVTVQLSHPNTSGRPVSVGVGDYTRVVVKNSSPPRTYGDAKPGVDYEAFAPFRLTFAPGASAATFPIELCGDTTAEGDEHINVRISGADGVQVADNDLSIYLVNDD